MNWLRRWVNWLRALLGHKQWVGQNADDVPDRPSSRTVYLVGDESSPPWAAALLCPCGCKELIQLSLISGDNPSWRADVGRNGLVTLHPSVWRVRGCHSHFFVRDGRILWARDGRPSHGRPALGRPSTRY
ncbi:DUF6527 family protein [Sphingomonas sp. SRS2]|uniref:DUF6527 family protein n=1 Tax=Sphingomonas sp. SRS2 TaxID=133190 RepID=UPI003FA7E491